LAFLLDTCIAIDLRDSRGNTLDRVTALSERPLISAITKVELEGGVYAQPEHMQKRRKAVDVLLRRLEVIDFDDVMASQYGEIISQASFSRRKITDRMIAATALVNNLTLITSNGDDFADIAGLKLEIWKP
jgi:tRNA(fMet)-specific endonuclease VapC